MAAGVLFLWLGVWLVFQIFDSFMGEASARLARGLVAIILIVVLLFFLGLPRAVVQG